MLIFLHFPICKGTFPAKTSDLHLIPISLVTSSVFLLVLKMQLLISYINPYTLYNRVAETRNSLYFRAAILNT